MPSQVLGYGASGSGKTSVLGMRRVFAGGVFLTAVQAIWRELAAVEAHSRVSVEVLPTGPALRCEPKAGSSAELTPSNHKLCNLWLYLKWMFHPTQLQPVKPVQTPDVDAGVVCGAAPQQDPRPADGPRQQRTPAGVPRQRPLRRERHVRHLFQHC